MISLFRRRRSNRSSIKVFAEITRLPPDAVINLAHDMICNLDPNGGVMTLIAYKNVKPILEAMQDVAATKNDASVPKSIDEFIVFLCRDIDGLGTSINDEMSRRRMMWFIHSLIVMKANEIAASNPERAKAISEIWLHLILCSRVLKNALVDNILWSNEEKYWFGTDKDPFAWVPTEAKAMTWCINLAMPHWLKNNDHLLQGLARWCIAEVGQKQALDYYRKRAAEFFRATKHPLNEVHGIVSKRLAIQYEEIANDISAAGLIRHSNVVWRNWIEDHEELGAGGVS